MTQLFHPATNTFSRFSIFGAVFILGLLGYLLFLLYRSPYQTEVNVAKDQPVPFSHAHHVGSIGIDCRYCHISVEESSFAGMPSTSVCMGCHSVLWKDSPLLEPVRESYRTKTPLAWTRVYDVPDYTYFNHSIHVAKGVACITCHGKVNEMPLMWKANTLHMQWCLECHRNPERYIGEKAEVFTMPAPFQSGPVIETADPHAVAAHGAEATHEEPKQVVDPLERGRKLVEHYGIVVRQLDDCSVCHR